MIDGREIALANLMVLDADPPGVVTAAVAAGFDAVTLRLADGTGDPNPLVDDAPTRARTAAPCASTGSACSTSRSSACAPTADVAALEPMLACAAELGARHLLVVSQDPDPRRSARTFAAVADAAAVHGVRAVLEFMVFSAVRTIADAWAILEASERPDAGLLVDPLHLARSGGSPADVAALAAAHPARFPYAQLCDAPATAPGTESRVLFTEAVEDRLLPGEGGLPLRELIAGLPAGVPLSVETPTRALAAAPPAERARRAIAATAALLS